MEDEIIIEELETDNINLDETNIDDIEMEDNKDTIVKSKSVIDLGKIETNYKEETYEDVLNRIEELYENGDYIFKDSYENGFYVHTEVNYYENNRTILQYYWTADEGSVYKRIGCENSEGTIDWGNFETIATYEMLAASFAQKNHNHFTTDTTTSLTNWLNNFKTNSSYGNPSSLFRVTYNNEKYNVEEWWYNTATKNYRSQRYFNENNPNEVYARKGTYTGNTTTWDKWTRNIYCTEDGLQTNLENWLNDKVEEGIYEVENNSYKYELHNTKKGNYLYQKLFVYGNNGTYEEKIRIGTKENNTYTFSDWSEIISI